MNRRVLTAAFTGFALLTVVFGLVVGGLLSTWAVRALSGVVVATDHFDFLSAGVAAAVLMVVGVGSVLPAARTDPLIALRSE